jgi:uncharacterized protein (TIGR02217 family)
MTLALFPTLPGITWPVQRTPSFSTDVPEGVGGRRTAIRYQMEPRWKYDIPIEFLRDQTGFTEYTSLLNLYQGCFGRFFTFLFNDLRDNTATNQPIGIGDGTTTKFYLVRSFAGFTQRVAGAALNGTPTIKVAGVTQSPSAFTIDPYGVVTFNVAPAAGAAVTITMTFYWICRFDEDQLDLSQFMDRWWDCKSIKLSTEIIT